jgi:TetR/AcrR family transcriptional regulator
MPRPRSDIRPRILEAARGRFVAAGVDASSLRSIAADAGTSLGMIYYYFPSKEELFLAVVEEVYGQLLGDLEQALEGARDFRGSLLGLYRRIAAASPLELDVVRLVAREALTSAARLESLAQRFRRGHIPLLLQALGAALSRGELRRDLHPGVLLAATIALGTLPQFALPVVRKSLPGPLPSPEQLTEQLAEAVLHGIAAPR